MKDNEEFNPTPEQLAIQKVISEVASGLEKEMGPIVIACYEKRRDMDPDAKIFLGAVHMALCCMMAKVYGISCTTPAMDGTNLSSRRLFLESVKQGTDYFIERTEERKPQMMVDALLQAMKERFQAMNKEKQGDA